MAGHVILLFGGDHAGAASVIDRALMLNPNSAHAWMARGAVSYFQNRPGPAIEGFERAMRLSPLDPLGYLFTCGLAFGHTIARRYEEAMEWVDRSLRECHAIARRST
jgi:adenylate cyclase